jgi:hypothetical protein
VQRCAVSTGWASVGLLSIASAASAWYCATTPSDVTIRSSRVDIVRTVASWRIGFRTPDEDRLIVGSIAIGIPNPPVEPVPSAIAVRSSSARLAFCTAVISSGVMRIAAPSPYCSSFAKARSYSSEPCVST